LHDRLSLLDPPEPEILSLPTEEESSQCTGMLRKLGNFFQRVVLRR
jgi:hypothetical protein